jgi:acyl-CoA reductase-like NAD-dependent aldehyde dehydrogenase
VPSDVRPVLVAGQWRPSSGAETLEVRDPSTGEVVGVVPAGCADDAKAAVAAAREAAPGWARTRPGDRAAALKAAARRLRAHVDELAALQGREGGKPVGDSRGGVEAGIGTLEQYAELGPLHRGRSLQGGWGAADLMVHEPRGVAVVLTPWNDPVAITLQGLGATLAAGNTVVYSPSERTPLCGHRVAELLADELPPGVLNLVHGDARVGRPLVEDPDVDLVYHVGSSVTGREIAQVCARTGAKAVLEGGGKDACVVDADVDPEWAAAQVALGAFANAGQICVSVERVYVAEAVAEPFLAALVREAESRVGGAWDDPATTLGPLVDERQRDPVHGHVTDAVELGAQLLAGGRVPDGPGSHYPATVLAGCIEEMAVMREETFGPVAAVQVVPDFDAALAAAARSAYGLAATVLTRDMAHAQRAWRELPVGTVKVNAVFGGAPGGAAEPHRGSGQGFGYGPELLDEVTITKVVHLGLPPA